MTFRVLAATGGVSGLSQASLINGGQSNWLTA